MTIKLNLEITRLSEGYGVLLNDAPGEFRLPADATAYGWGETEEDAFSHAPGDYLELAGVKESELKGND